MGRIESLKKAQIKYVENNREKINEINRKSQKKKYHAQRALPAPVPRTGHAREQAAGLRDFRGGDHLRPGAHSLRRHAVHGRWSQGLPLSPYGPSTGPKLAPGFP